MTPLMIWPRWGPRGVVIVSAPAHIQSSVCHRLHLTTGHQTRISSNFTIASRHDQLHHVLFLWQCLYTYLLCVLGFFNSLARLGLKLFWLILMAVLDSTLKYFVLSLFVCLRLGGHTQLPPVLVLSALLPPSRLFLTLFAISVKTKHSGSPSPNWRAATES